MIWLRLAGAFAALLFGLCTAFRPKTPLFYKIIFFGVASCFLGSCYEALASLLRPSAVQGFHVGWLGHVGLFFFLYSSYYGAFNSLADSGERDWRLAPGQQLAVEESGVKVRRVNVKDYVCWREGTYIFKGERLEDIAKTMNRWYGKDVVFLEESIKDKLFTGILDKGVGIEVFMRQLSETSGIKFVVSGNQLFIK